MTTPTKLIVLVAFLRDEEGELHPAEILFQDGETPEME